MIPGRFWLVLPLAACGCQDLDRFDTSGDGAFCGSIVGARFVRTIEEEGGFDRRLRLGLELDANALSTHPGTLKTDDAETGPCAPEPTFDFAPIVPAPEFAHDPVSSLLFDDQQEHNVLGWVTSSCRGPMLAVVSLLRSNDVEVRLMKPPAPAADGGEALRPAFALFKLDRHSEDCGF